MKWKNNVVVNADIDSVWDAIWNRKVLEDSVDNSVLAAEYNEQRVYGEHHEKDGFHQNYLVTLTILIDTDEFKSIHCFYTFNNAYVVNEYFELRKHKGVTKFNHFGTCSSGKYHITSRIRRGRKFCATKKNGYFCKNVKNFFE